MPKKYMTDYQRVKAGNWLENQKALIASDPTIQAITDKAAKALGHRVTTTFVRSYLLETEWFSEIKKKVEPVPPAVLQQAVGLTLEALDLIIYSEAKPHQIQETIERARNLIQIETKETKQFDLIEHDQMQGGHA